MSGRMPAGGGEPARAGRRLASWLRSRLWGGVFALASDGLTVEGSLPPGPCVLVANHSSHADTAALLAAFGRRRPLLAVAAADYWLSSPVRRAAASTLAGILPIDRGGSAGPAEDPLAAAADALAAGASVLLFPEGTRSRDGRLGRFHTGAFRLAARAGVPVVPIGVAGTREILPPHGELTRVPVAVRVGEPLRPPLDPADHETIRALADRAALRISQLSAAPARPALGRTWRRLSRWAAGRPGLALLGGWAFAEGVSWPLLAEFPLIGLLICLPSGVMAPRWRAAALVAVTALGSLLGIVVTWALAARGVLLPAPLTTARMHATAAAQLASDPARAFWAQTVDGIPVKVYARQAGLLHLTPGKLLATAWPHLLRVALVGVLARLAARPLLRYLAPCMGAAVIAAALLGAVAVWWLYGTWR